MSNRALFVSVGREAPTHLKDLGYVEALRRWGWIVTWEHLASYAGEGIEHFDLIIWDGAIPESCLKRIAKQQILIAMGGAGDNIAYYARHIERIRCAATSLFYFDEPAHVWSARNISRDLLLPHRVARLVQYERRFTRFASPRFWRDSGLNLLYLPYASDPSRFHPLTPARKRWHWGFCGTIYQRHLIPQLMKASAEKSIPFYVAAGELRTAIEPSDLNEFYNSIRVGPNEHWHGVFGRELNQRVFDLGMAGVFQISDMEWLAKDPVGPYATFYAGKAANATQRRRAVALTLEHVDQYSAEQIHEWFRARHSFEARLLSLSCAISEDLSLGRAGHSEVQTARNTTA